MRFGILHAGTRRCAFVVPEADAISDGGIDPTLHLATRVLQKGVGFVMPNHGRQELVPAPRSQFPALPVALIAIDNVEFGRVQGPQVRKLVPESGGTVLYIRGNPGDSANRDRATGMKEELQHAAASRSRRRRRTGPRSWPSRTCTSGSRRRSAASCSSRRWSRRTTTWAPGARRALRAADELGRPDLKTVPVIGGDGLPDFGQRWVAEGVLTATVCVTLPGRPAVQQIAQHWRNGTPLPAVTKLPVRSHPDLATLRPAGA